MSKPHETDVRFIAACTEWEIWRIEKREDNSLVVRLLGTDGDMAQQSAIDGLTASLSEVVTGFSALHVYRDCCDSVPVAGVEHIGDCERDDG